MSANLQRTNVLDMPLSKGAMERIRKQAIPQKEFDKWCKDLAKDLKDSVKWGEIQRTQWWVTMRRRFRGTSTSDWAGGFYPNISVSTDWCDVSGQGLHSLNIVKPTVRANEAVMVEARVQVKVEAGTSDGEIKGAAGVGQGVADYLEPRDWTESLEARINQSTQIAGAIFLRSHKNPFKPAETLKKDVWGEVELPMPGEYACECGSGGNFEGEAIPDDIGYGTTPCLECGRPAIVTKPSETVPFNAKVGEEEFRPADNDTEVVPMCEIRLDEAHTQGGEIDKAEWFERHYLVFRGKLEAEYPHIDFGEPEEWSYPLKWQQALRTGSQNVEWNIRGDQRNRELDQFEVREIYLRPERYKHRIEPTDFELLGPNDEVLFSIEAGQKLIDVAPDGIRFKICGEHLIGVLTERPNYKKEADNYDSCDFRDEYTVIQFLADADSFWSLGLVELEPVQMDINNLRTIDQQSKEKNAVTNIVYDSLMFDAEDWDYDLVPTRSGFMRDKPIRDYFQVAEAPRLDNGVMETTAWLLAEKNNLSGVQPAMIGQKSPGEPYAAQLLQKQQSQGLLAPSQQSKAQGKVRWTKQQLRIAQGWPMERFKYIQSKYGKEWKDEDIEAFLECDIERDLDISYVPGTEVSRSLVEQELRLDSFMQRMTVIAGATEGKGVPENTWTEIVGKLAEFGGVQIDVNNSEGDRRLAQDRYLLMQELCAEAEEMGETLTINVMDEQQMAEMRQMAQMTGQSPEPDPLVQAILSEPQFWVSPGEVYETHREFYADHLRALVSEEMPNALLINVVVGMLARQRVGFIEQGQSETENQIAVQQPMLDMQAQQAQAQQEGAQAEQQAAMEQEQAQAEAQRADAEAAQDIASADQAEQRDHERAMQEQQLSHAAAMKLVDMEQSDKQAKAAKGKK